MPRAGEQFVQQSHPSCRPSFPTAIRTPSPSTARPPETRPNENPVTVTRPETPALSHAPVEIERAVREHARRTRAAGEGPERMIVSLKQTMREVIDPHDSVFPRVDEQILRWALDEYYAPQPRPTT